MSNGFPKEFQQNVVQIGGLAVRSSTDMCKGCRSCCRSLVKTIAQNRVGTGCIIAIPMIIIAVCIIWLESILSMVPNLTRNPYYYEYKTVIFSPVYALTGITEGFGLIGILAIRMEYQNLLRFSAFVYRGIAHWVILTVFLFLIPLANFVPFGLILYFTLWSCIPAFIWLFSAAVMTGHSDLITAAIERGRMAPPLAPSAMEDV